MVGLLPVLYRQTVLTSFPTTEYHDIQANLLFTLLEIVQYPIAKTV